MKYLIVLLILSTLIFACQSKSESADDDADEKEDQATVANSGASFQDGTPLLIGTYTQDMGWVNGKATGMHIGILKNGKVELVQTVDVGPNPSFVTVHPNGKYVYAVNEVGGTADQPEGMVTALSIDASGGIEIINSRSSLGTSPCHVSVNQYGTQLMVANYGNGTIASFPIGLEGRSGRRNDVIQFSGKGNHGRQDGPHAHFIKEGPDKRIYTADLGTDSIRIYNLIGGVLERDGFIKTENQSGPRHLAFHSSQPIIYILNELAGTVEVWQEAGKTYKRIQRLSTLTDAYSDQEAHCGAIEIDKNGTSLYVSNRGDINMISTFSIAMDGTLTLQGMTSTQGGIPRDMEIDPSGKYLLVANQNSDNIVTFEINGSSGALENPKITAGIMTPVSITFL